MKLLHVSTHRSPDNVGYVRITGMVERGTGEQFDIWFEVPRELEADLSRSGNPWLVAMLPYALETGEPLVCEIAVDAALLENLKGLIAVWCEWYPQLIAPVIEVPIAPFDIINPQVGRTVAFFSGGIDSWFTVLRHAPELDSAALGGVDELLTVHGFDIPVESGAEFERLRQPLASCAMALGREMIVVKTNLRRAGSLWAKSWGCLTNGAGLATVALVLEGRFGTALIGSSYPYGHLGPWGSHPMTDALFSTRSLAIKQDGASFDRVEKTLLVAQHNMALSHLHVCWQSQSASNCGMCPKCLRTMATLKLLSIPQGATPFPVEFKAENLAALFVASEHDEVFIREIHAHSRRLGNRPIHAAATQALQRSRHLRSLFELAERVPVLWRLAPALRRWCLQ